MPMASAPACTRFWTAELAPLVSSSWSSCVRKTAATALAATLPRPPSSDVPPSTTAATDGRRYASPWNALGSETTPPRRMAPRQYRSAAATYAIDLWRATTRPAARAPLLLAPTPSKRRPATVFFTISATIAVTTIAIGTVVGTPAILLVAKSLRPLVVGGGLPFDTWMTNP